MKNTTDIKNNFKMEKRKWNKNMFHETRKIQRRHNRNSDDIFVERDYANFLRGVYILLIKRIENDDVVMYSLRNNYK